MWHQEECLISSRCRCRAFNVNIFHPFERNIFIFDVSDRLVECVLNRLISLFSFSYSSSSYKGKANPRMIFTEGNQKELLSLMLWIQMESVLHYLRRREIIDRRLRPEIGKVDWERRWKHLSANGQWTCNKQRFVPLNSDGYNYNQISLIVSSSKFKREKKVSSAAWSRHVCFAKSHDAAVDVFTNDHPVVWINAIVHFPFHTFEEE